MPGFPPIDELYYENPSRRIGGSIAYQLQLTGSNSLPVMPAAGAPFFDVQRHHFESLDVLVDHLSESDDDSTYYRGQTRRHPAIYSGQVRAIQPALPRRGPFRVCFESMIPSKFRRDVGTEDPDWDGYTMPSPIDQIAPGIRAVVDSDYEPLRDLLTAYLEDVATNPEYLVHKLLQRDGLARVPLPESTTAGGTLIHERLHQLISIAQHYEMKSSMIDITGDVEVAAWFASHTWDGDSASGRGDGVIYRFDAADLNWMIRKELAAESAVGEQIVASGLLGIVDISDVDEQLGLRPGAQVGGSVYGLANSVVYALLSAYDVLEFYTFPLESVTGEETPLSKTVLCPPDDPVTAVFDPAVEFDEDPLRPDEIEDFLHAEGFSEEERDRLLRAKEKRLL